MGSGQQEVITTSILTKNGKRALANAFSYDKSTGKVNFTGITFTGGGVSEMPISDTDAAVPDTFSALKGKVVNVASIGNALTVSVTYRGTKVAKALSLHCLNMDGKEVVFAICDMKDGLSLNVAKTVRFSIALSQATETGEDATELSFVNGATATVDEIGNFRTELEDRISDMSATVTSIQSQMNDITTDFLTASASMQNLHVSEKATFDMDAQMENLEVKHVVPKNTTMQACHIGRTDSFFGSVSAGVYIGRTAVYENTGYLAMDTVYYPTGDTEKGYRHENAPDAMFGSISSTNAMNSKVHADIILKGHSTEQGTENPNITLRAIKDNDGTVLGMSHNGVMIVGDTTIDGELGVLGFQSHVSDLGYVHIAGNFISVPKFNGAKILENDDTSGVNPLNIQARILPSGNKACIGSSEQRWKLYAGQADVEGIKFSSLPEITGVGNTRKAEFPVGCMTMLCIATKAVTVCDVLDGNKESLRIWDDVGGTAAGNLIQTKNKFVALSCAVAGRPFLAQCIG